MSSEDNEVITGAAIARWAGVGRAAVSNWRRRYPDFPQPAGGTSRNPKFSRAEVEAWLTATGKGDQLATAGRTDTGTHRLDDATSVEVRNEDSAPETALSMWTTGELLARVMVSLLPDSAMFWDLEDAELPVVMDPACASGTVLMAVADRFGEQVAVAGQDIDESLAAAASLNLRTRADNVTYEINPGDSLLDNRFSKHIGNAVAVLCEPPVDQRWPRDELVTDPRWKFGIPEVRDAELAWVQHCYAHLRPGGMAVVAVSPRTCIQSSGQSIRAALVRSGVLRDVIALPTGMGSDPNTDRYLWVLERPSSAQTQSLIRMTDLSGLGEPADVPHEFALWRRFFADADPVVCRLVDRVELLDGNISLLPSRFLTARIDVNATDLARVTDRLARLYERIGQGLPRFVAPERSTRPSSVTIGELERASALTVRSRDTVPRAGDVLIRTLGRPPIVATGTDSDESGLAQVIELDLTLLDPHFVATFLQRDANAVPVSNTLGALGRDDLRRCRIPRLPLSQQRCYGDAFRYLHDLHSAVTALTNTTSNVIDQTIHALTVGTVSPGPDPPMPAARSASHHPPTLRSEHRDHSPDPRKDGQ
ncbi:N-6 DNA methylase [Mycobacterium sp. pUA109]|uniref:N-6 DNA methylase n=1 Tax=Mycobacterium sp. pUA109 TaxID=3238982 RepID=UPI00351B2502